MESSKKDKKPKKEESEEEEEEEIEDEEQEEEDEVGEDFSKDPRAMTYLADAGKIADQALDELISKCKVGASIHELCVQSDAKIAELLTKVYTKKKFIKGVAFPTSISLNEVAGHFSATGDIGDDQHEYKSLSEGDLVKLDLGVQINGFAAVLAHTIVVSEKGDVVTGRKADVILAAYNALQAGLRQFYEKKFTNNQVTKTVKDVVSSYKATPVEGVLSHRMKRDIIDGTEVIINNQTVEQRVEERQFDYGDVFGFDVIVSSGEGKPRETGIKTSIFKRALETTYKLKTESARKLLSVVEQNFHTFPFSFNSFDNEEAIRMKNPIQNLKSTAKMGLVECLSHELLHPYPVLAEKKGEFVAQFKWTVAVRKEGPLVIAGKTVDLAKFNSEYKIEDKDALTHLEVL
jgi:curved DNA binding protein